MVSSEEGKLESLEFCLKGTKRNLVGWGQEYLRHLSGEIGGEYNKRVEKNESTSDLLELVDTIVPQFMNHNEEPEAVDLLMEVEQLEKLETYSSENNYERVCNYLLSCAQYAADTEEMNKAYTTTYKIYMKMKQYPSALRVAQRLNDENLIAEVMSTCQERATLNQLSMMLARQRNAYNSSDEDLQKLISNEKLSENFKVLCRDLDVLEPKHPDSVFKTHLEETKQLVQLDSAKQNLAITYANAFINAGYCKDLLMTPSFQSSGPASKENWLYKNKDKGMLAATASLGMILLWDIDEGLVQLDKFMDSSDDNIVAGSYLAMGIVNCGIKNECDPVQAILLEKLEQATKQSHKIGALMGLSLAYAGSARQDLLEAISPIVLDSSNTIELQAVAAVSIGLIYVGSCDQDAAESIVQTLMEKDEKELESPFAKIFALGLGLLYLGQQDSVEAISQVCQLFQNENYKAYVELVLEGLAYACSGNVLKVQKLMQVCADHKKENESILNQIAAVLGIALVAFGEDIGTDMAIRQMNHIL